jgi:hypothetical protein
MLKCSRSKRKYRAFIEKNKDFFRRIPRSAMEALEVPQNQRQKYEGLLPAKG